MFDWGDTLIRFPGILSRREAHLACVNAAVETVIPNDGEDLAKIDRHAFLEAYAQVSVRLVEESERTHREHSFEQRLRLAFESFGKTPPAASLAKLARAIAAEITARAELVEGAAEVVTALAGQVRLGLVSNYPSALTVNQTLHRFGLMPQFDVVVVSETVGWLKPNRRPFEEAFAGTGAHAAEVLFVGNDLSSDMRGAKAMGCRTAWLAPAHADATTVSDVDIHLPRLCDLLSRIGV